MVSSDVYSFLKIFFKFNKTESMFIVWYGIETRAVAGPIDPEMPGRHGLDTRKERS